jgi:hypothetical protein
MSESVQAVLALLMIVGAIGCGLVFVSDRVNWAAFAGMLTLAIGNLGLLLWSLFRHDRAADFLREVEGPLFERDGFCFKPRATAVKGRCYLDLHFQSRYDRPSKAVVVLQPSRGFLLVRPDLASMTVEIDCPAGGCGITSFPWPVPRTFQGQVLSLDLGADVIYPEGRGNMIRYHGGIQVPARGVNRWRYILTFAAAVGGMIVLPETVSVKLKLPVDVAESIDDNSPIVTTIERKLSEKPEGPSAHQDRSRGLARVSRPAPRPAGQTSPPSFTWQTIASGNEGPGPRSRHGLV